MYRLSAKDIELSINTDKGFISSIKIGERECCVEQVALFTARLRNKSGECFYISATEAKRASVVSDGIVYTGFGNVLSELSVKVTATADEAISWKIAICSVPQEYAIEWVELPKACLPRLIDNNAHGGKLLFPYNEGVIITDETKLKRYEPEFPSSGAYLMFPNMVCSQFMAYLFDDIGLYIGAHDPKRGLKCVDFYPNGNGISFQMRLYSGMDFGQDFRTDFPIVWQVCTGEWKSAACIYRAWFESNLPPRVMPTVQNKSLPKWYEDAPVVITYPVRGIHDMDKMEPNNFYPYVNALPALNKIKEATGARIMALLMHWEGTAPWAPPYVWPPFGGEEPFNQFKDELHKNGDLLGVYCSGFGYTLQSTLIESYNCKEKIEKENVLQGVCHSPQNKPELGITCCPYQRYGYDICPASKKGREILNEAYSPLFKSGIDYAQILDQNHGGGQYMCYAREHNHPPMPGEWMTSNMQALLSQWNSSAPNMLFGCESAAAEPFIGNLAMSDNRYELNYAFGTPVPLYAFIYHEYVRNFMGNQVGCSFDTRCDTLRYRLGYSFSIGDLMTLTLSPSGELMTHWGTRDFDNCPDMEKALIFIKNLTKFYNDGAKEYLYAGRMSAASTIKCENVAIPLSCREDPILLPRLLCSSWEAENGKTAHIAVNPESTPVTLSIENESYEVPALNAILIVK